MIWRLRFQGVGARMRGTPYALKRANLNTSVHPRACGELGMRIGGPRVHERFIPAHAGNSA